MGVSKFEESKRFGIEHEFCKRCVRGRRKDSAAQASLQNILKDCKALQQSLAETLSSGSLGSSGSSGNVANYMGQMAMAMGKLGTLEGFIRQVFLLKFWFSFLTIRIKSWSYYGLFMINQKVRKWIYCGTGFRLLGLAFTTIILWSQGKGSSKTI